MAFTEQAVMDQAKRPARDLPRARRRLSAAMVLAAAALGLAGCQHGNDGYPSPYGPSRATPLLPPLPVAACGRRRPSAPAAMAPPR